MSLQKLGRRHLVVAMISLCYMLNFIVRVSFPLTLIQMVQTQESESEDFEFTCNNGNRSQTGSKLKGSEISDNTLPSSSIGTAEPTFDWESNIIGHLLSAYGMGHILGNLTGGLFCSLIGGKKYMAIALTLSGISQLASPIAAETSPWLLYSLRFLFGACVSFILLFQLTSPTFVRLLEHIHSGWSDMCWQCTIGKVDSHSRKE